MNSIVALPIAAAVPTSSPLSAAGTLDRRALHAYASWLFMERRILCGELWPHVGKEAERFDWADNPGFYWHCEGPVSWKDKPQPSSRAAAILDMVGVDWRYSEGGRFECGLDHADTGERPELPNGWPKVDSELTSASSNLNLMDIALRGIDEAHVDYQKIHDSWRNSVEVLSHEKARSWDGVWQKAAAIRNLDDEDAISSIAKSLAADILERAFAFRKPEAV